jgi:hypothetical protein
MRPPQDHFDAQRPTRLPFEWVVSMRPALYFEYVEGLVTEMAPFAP